MVTIHLHIKVTVLVPSVLVKQAKQTKQCLYCLAVLAVYHEQKYTVSQCLKIVSSLDPRRHSVPHVCEGWWSSGCRGSGAEHRRLKSEVSWVRLLATAGLFTFLHFPGFDSWRLPAFSLSSIFAS